MKVRVWTVLEAEVDAEDVYKTIVRPVTNMNSIFVIEKRFRDDQVLMKLKFFYKSKYFQ